MFFVSETIKKLSQEFELIPNERKGVLESVASFVGGKVLEQLTSELIFICTHNSRRSHIAQIWAQTAASYFSIPNVNTYSGGTEATAFNPRAVDTLRRIGFKIDLASSGTNPKYVVRYADEHPPFEVFSKRYNDGGNPNVGFAAIITCTQADMNCPIVVGSSIRISLPYDDPKRFDGMAMESDKYTERSLEIGREMLFAFSQIRKQ